MIQEHAIHVPCVSCGAPLPLDMNQGTARCAHCDNEQPISEEILVRSRAHLSTLAELEQRGGDALGEAAYYKRMGRSWIGFAGAIGLNVGMVGGVWLLYFIREALVDVVGDTLATVIIVPLGLVGLIAVLAGWGVFLTQRKKMRAEFKAVEVGVVGCDHCGASVPVAVGRALRCPFCEAELVSGDGTSRRAEAAAQQQVHQMMQQAASERHTYQEKVIQQAYKGNRFARIWMGICFGSIAGLPFMFGLESLGVPDSLLFLGLLPGVGMGVGIAIWVNRRRGPNAPS